MTLALVWFVGGILLCVLEALQLTFVLLWFGIGALAAAGVALVTPEWAWQAAAFALVTAGLWIWTRPIAMRLFKVSAPYVSGIERLVGQEAVVVKTVHPLYAGKGQVKLDGIYWSAGSPTAEPIKVGARVQVVRVEGARLVVKDLSHAKGEAS